MFRRSNATDFTSQACEFIRGSVPSIAYADTTMFFFFPKVRALNETGGSAIGGQIKRKGRNERNREERTRHREREEERGKDKGRVEEKAREGKRENERAQEKEKKRSCVGQQWIRRLSGDWSAVCRE